MAPKGGRIYTVKEVEAFRDRLRRQHIKEMNEARQQYYEMGLRDGKEQLKQALNDLLKIEVV